MRRGSRPAVVALCAAFALVGVACGDGDDEPARPTTADGDAAMTREEFVRTWRDRQVDRFAANVEETGIDAQQASALYDEFLGCTFDAIADEPGLAERALGAGAEEDEELDQQLRALAGPCQEAFEAGMQELLAQVTTTTGAR